MRIVANKVRIVRPVLEPVRAPIIYENSPFVIHTSNGSFSLFYSFQSSLSLIVVSGKCHLFAPFYNLIIERIRLFGMWKKPSKVLIDGKCVRTRIYLPHAQLHFEVLAAALPHVRQEHTCAYIYMYIYINF